MKYFIDANIFLRLIEKEESKNDVYEECYSFFKKIENEKITVFTSSLVLSEVAWVLGSYYDRDKKYVLKAISTIERNRQIKIKDGHDPRTAIDIFSENKVKFIDAMIASNKEIQEGDMKVVSYDKDFDKIEVERVEPKDVLKNI